MRNQLFCFQHTESLLVLQINILGFLRYFDISEFGIKFSICFTTISSNFFLEDGDASSLS